MSPARRFRFSLESVLQVRRLREEQARLELIQAIGRLEKSRAALDDAQRLLAGRLAEFQAASGRTWQAQDYRLLRSYLEHLKTAIIGWRERIARQLKHVEEKQLILKRLHQERRLLARLREKKYAEFRREVAKVWEKETEALVLSRWGRLCEGRVMPTFGITLAILILIQFLVRPLISRLPGWMNITFQPLV